MSKNASLGKSDPKVVAQPSTKKIAKTAPGNRQPNGTAKPKKEKVIRDSFTMPESEYELITVIKKRCIARGLAVKKSEILRAAVRELAAKNDALIVRAVKTLEVIKTGRPPKGHK